MERRLVFNATALFEVIAKSVNKPSDAIKSFTKIAEGGSYRVFEAKFDDELGIIVRLPYPCTLPRSFGIASEVATMQFLRLQGIPIPEIFDWASSAENPVGSEYIVMAKAKGKELEESWYSMTISERMSMTERIVDLEEKLFQIRFPSSGSIYHRSFLRSRGIGMPPISTAGVDAEEVCIGPSSAYLWWYGDRDRLTINRGPCMWIPESFYATLN